MGARSKARKRALDVLFEADQRGADERVVLQRISAEATSPLNPYVQELVSGIMGNRDRIDEMIATYAEGWTLDRMPAVDRNLLRIAVYELLFERETPVQVVIDEAVTLASSLSTDESPGFINGLLGRIASVRDRIATD